ncbi:hypothetical protein BpHYR1_016795 [Brachionus plicatilis]|uniref:Uncharacterized protein n=1 Tax=Brachionus plicatilis TaxID=10195 RepID=A0A3M7RLX4_BRAPC|nr:hypothetical protein BpHYR1_016795 [Brachionus plicatilis]
MPSLTTTTDKPEGEMLQASLEKFIIKIVSTNLYKPYHKNTNFLDETNRPFTKIKRKGISVIIEKINNFGLPRKQMMNWRMTRFEIAKEKSAMALVPIEASDESKLAAKKAFSNHPNLVACSICGSNDTCFLGLLSSKFMDFFCTWFVHKGLQIYNKIKNLFKSLRFLSIGLRTETIVHRYCLYHQFENGQNTTVDSLNLVRANLRPETGSDPNSCPVKNRLVIIQLETSRLATKTVDFELLESTNFATNPLNINKKKIIY